MEAEVSTAEVAVLVVGAGGGVGGLFVRSLAGEQGIRLSAVDVNVGPEVPDLVVDDCIVDDIVNPSEELLRLLRATDVVVLAVPEPVAEAAAEVILRTVRPDVLVVDTLSVKGAWLELVGGVRDEVGGGPELLSIDPLFAPSLGFEGRPVAVVGRRPGPRSDWFCSLLRSWGAELVDLEPGEFDKATASLQVATHAAILAFGLALDELNHDVERLAPLFTPPHRTMLSLLARICAGDSHVYHGLQHSHPGAREARAALASGLQKLEDVAAQPDSEAFASVTAGLTKMLSALQPQLEEDCAAIFSRLK